MELASRILKVLFRIEATIATLAYGCVAIFILADVVWREVIGEGMWIGTQRFAVYMTLIAGTGGLGLAAAAGAHIRPRVADHWVPKRWDPVMNRISDALIAVIFLTVAWYAAEFVHSSFELGFKARVLGWPEWMLQLGLPIGFASAAFRYICFAIWPALRPVQQMVSE